MTTTAAVASAARCASGCAAGSKTRRSAIAGCARKRSAPITRGALKHFHSSNLVRRGFCADCGTPLTYEAPDGIALAAGAFDDPAALPPRIQYGLEAKLPFADALHRLPGMRTEDDLQAAPFLAQVVSRQHPDHDTERWPA